MYNPYRFNPYMYNSYGYNNFYGRGGNYYGSSSRNTFNSLNKQRRISTGSTTPSRRSNNSTVQPIRRSNNSISPTRRNSGYRSGTTRRSSSGGKNKITAAILALCFGVFGVHRFYLGQWKLGLVYLLLSWTVVPLFIGVIDGILFLIMSEEKFNAKYNQ